MEIYAILRKLASSGIGILMISSEMPEIIGMCNRVYVMHEGRIMGEIPGSEATEEMILMMAKGQIMGNEEDRVP